MSDLNIPKYCEIGSILFGFKTVVRCWYYDQETDLVNYQLPITNTYNYLDFKKKLSIYLDKENRLHRISGPATILYDDKFNSFQYWYENDKCIKIE